LSEYLKKLYLF